MASDSDHDPSATFQQMLTQWERNFDKFANELMSTEAYTRAMNQFQQSQLAAQKAFSEFMTQQLTGMNMPTRDDVVRIGEALRELDRRVERVERLLEARVPAPGTPRRGPPRTRKPPSAAGG